MPSLSPLASACGSQVLETVRRQAIAARPAVWFVVAVIATTAAPSTAGTVQICDFTASGTTAIGVHGGRWLWDQPSRTLLVGLSNVDADYLQWDYSALDVIDIAGGTALQLTGSWAPDTPGAPTASGSFVVELQNSGALIALARFTYGEFVGGNTVSHALEWSNPVPTTHVTQWELHGAGFPNNTDGDLQLTNMLVVTGSPVPEIDPAGLGSVLALVTGTLGLLERRRRRAA